MGMIKSEAIESVKDVISGIIEKMGVEGTIEIREHPETVVFNIRTRDSNMLIGQHGINLAALQYICRVLSKRKFPESQDLDFIIDVDDYKKKREGYLVSLAQKVYKEALHSKKIIVLKPMTSYERRLIHTALSKTDGVVTGRV